jgi:predicted ATP-dependent endonuclease of OLD family
MLKNLTLENYRCFSHHQITLKDLSIIVGKNNAGKSTLIEAFRLLSLVTNRYKHLALSNVPNWLDAPLYYKGVSPSLKGLEFFYENIFHLYQDPPATITAEFINKSKVKMFIGPDSKLHAVLIGSNGKALDTRGKINNINLMPIYILPQISPVLKDEKPLVEEYVKSNLASSLASHHFRNQLQYLREHFFDFKKLSESTWHGLRIREFVAGNKFEERNPSLFVQDESFVAEIGWMGHGLQMWLQVMWFLARIPKNATVILDEPDVYMHADLQRKLIRFLKTRYKQIIIATHSIEIMSEVDPENILVIDKSKKSSMYTSSFPAVQKLIQHIGSLQNIQLARLWSAKKILLVEGKDNAILKRLQNTMFKDSEEPFDMLPNMAIGGWGGWSYAIGSSMLMKNAVDSSIVTYCILDSDYHNKEEIKDRYKDAHDKQVRLHIWQRKEIENYLLVPVAIFRIISKGKRSSKPLSVEIICNKL